MVKDGWKWLGARSMVYVTGGCVTRGMVLDSSGWLSATAYKYDKKLKEFVSCAPVKYETFRKGYREDRYILS